MFLVAEAEDPECYQTLQWRECWFIFSWPTSQQERQSFVSPEKIKIQKMIYIKYVLISYLCLNSFAFSYNAQFIISSLWCSECPTSLPTSVLYFPFNRSRWEPSAVYLEEDDPGESQGKHRDNSRMTWAKCRVGPGKAIFSFYQCLSFTSTRELRDVKYPWKL